MTDFVEASQQLAAMLILHGLNKFKTMVRLQRQTNYLKSSMQSSVYARVC